MANLVDKMTKLYDRVYPVSDKFGVKTHCDFSYVVRDTGVTVLVTPRPQLSSPPVNKLTAWERSGVEVNNDTLYIRGISRTFDSIRKGTFCNINGKPYTIMWLDTEQSVTFNILCRPERAR